MLIKGQPARWTNLRALIEQQAAELGERPFLYTPAGWRTYAELDRSSNSVARSLRDLGVRRRQVVGSLLYNCPEQLILWFALMKLGAIWTPLNVSLARDDLRHALQDSGMSLLVTEGELLERLSGYWQEATVRLILVGPPPGEQPAMTTFDELLTSPSSPLEDEPEPAPGDPACIVYTGGTTGLPKGVLLPHFAFICAGYRYRELLHPSPDDGHITIGQMFHIGGQQIGIVGPWMSGMRTAMNRWFSASGFWDEVRAASATRMMIGGAALAVLCKQPPRPDDATQPVRLAACGAAQTPREMREEFERRFNITLLEVYGQTESGVFLTSEREGARRAGSCGKPWGWTEIRIADNEDNELPPGTLGHVLMRPTHAYSFMLQFVNKPEATLDKWRNLWLHTGDLGYVDADGYFFFTGREAHWIRRRAENVAALEVEAAIEAHPGVTTCVVVGVPSDLGDEDIKAYVQVDAGAALQPTELVAWCEDRLAYFKVPRYIEFVDGFTRTATKGEIERHLLRDRGVGAAWDREAAGYVLGRDLRKASAGSRRNA